MSSINCGHKNNFIIKNIFLMCFFLVVIFDINICGVNKEMKNILDEDI